MTWPRPPRLDALADPFWDLVAGGGCVVCARPGRVLCAPCAAGLPRSAVPVWPDPTPPGLATPWGTAAYDGAVRALVLAHKERAVHALRVPLATLLAASVAGAAPGPGPVLLVPVPSRPGSARARGHDPTWTLTRVAARQCRRAGTAAVARRLLVSRGGVVDQAGLDAAGRAANLAGSMWCPGAGVRRLAGLRLRVVVCDDVLTTGATVREAQRALEAVGVSVTGVAVVAATRRRAARGAKFADPPLSPPSPVA